MRLHIDYHDQPSLRGFQKRIKLFYFLLIFLFAGLTFRLIYLQIIQGNELYAFSEKNLLKEIRVQAPRGIIYDRDQNPLVENLPNFALTLSPQFVQDLDALTKELEKIIGMSQKEIKQHIKKRMILNGPYRPVIVKNFLSRGEIIQIELLKIEYQGINIEELIFRHYIQDALLAHVLGYTGEVSARELPRLQEKKGLDIQQGDIIGKRGLEEKFNIYLQGDNGTSFVKVDAKGQQKLSDSISFLGHIEDINAVPGLNVDTTLDLDLQKAGYEAFVKHERQGTLVAINKQGEILALVNYPSFDPNLFSKGITVKEWSALINNPSKPLRNRAIQDHHPPGSTFKPIVALASLQEEKLRENTLVYAPSTFRFGRRTYHDHTRTGQGYITVAQAIEMSSNVFFYKQGLELGVDTIAKYAKALGIGKRTGIDLLGEVPGLMPTTEWKKERIGEPWQAGENLSTAIGQGFVLTTPIQLASAYMAIGNGGKVYRPHIVKRVYDNNNNTVLSVSPELVKDLSDKTKPYYISEETLKVVRKGLYRVANGERGTARWAKIPNFEIAGKTGTAQVRGFSASEIYQSCPKRPFAQRHHGWYVAFGPYEEPEMTVLVLTEHSCSSSKSVPIVKDFFQEYVKKYHPQLVTQKEESKK